MKATMKVFAVAVCPLAGIVLATGCASTTKSATAIKPLNSASTCQEWADSNATVRSQFADREVAAVPVPPADSQGTVAAAYAYGYIGGHCYRAEQAGHAATTTLATVLGLTTPSTSPPTVARAPTSPAAPTTTPAFSLDGHTEHGDAIRLVGRWGPILDRAESDVDPAVLRQCPDTDGRELVRKLELTATITSGLSGDVRLGGFAVQITEENQHGHLLLDYVLAGPEGTNCYRDTTESAGSVDLGTLQPHVPGHATAWVVLLDAITPRDPHPSATKLAQEEWGIGYPAVSVNGASALGGGGELLVTG